MDLNWTNVDALIKECILNDKTDAAILAGVDLDNAETAVASLRANGAIVVETAMQQMAFNMDRLEARREDIKSMLSQLPDTFMRSSGGGMSMMQMPFKGDDMEQWGEQWQADLLYALGAGVGLAAFLLPRDMWSRLPGSMPYIVVDL